MCVRMPVCPYLCKYERMYLPAVKKNIEIYDTILVK